LETVSNGPSGSQVNDAENAGSHPKNYPIIIQKPSIKSSEAVMFSSGGDTFSDTLKTTLVHDRTQSGVNDRRALMPGMNHRVESEFVHYMVERLRPLGPVVAKRMFGGHGLFLHDVMFALIMWDTLYFKVDEVNRPNYETLGLAPFSYVGQKGNAATMNYYEAPPECLDDALVLRRWANDAHAAALRAQPRKGDRAKNERLG
jgi:DNA transformation protein